MEKIIIQGPMHVHEPFRLICEVLEKVDYYFHTVVAGKKFKSLSKFNMGLYLYQYCLYFLYCYKLYLWRKEVRFNNNQAYWALASNIKRLGNTELFYEVLSFHSFAADEWRLLGGLVWNMEH
jgi:hypothetical protein